MNLNRVTLAGNLTRDPQVRFLSNEQAVANFGLAINRKYKGGDGQMKEDVTFVDCEAWGRTAELIGQHLTKGRNVYIEGRLKLDTWDDKDGKKHQRLKVVIDNLQFIGAKPQGGNEPPPAAGTATTAPTPAPRATDDEPPF